MISKNATLSAQAARRLRLIDVAVFYAVLMLVDAAMR